jgi:hypothetical protein
MKQDPGGPAEMPCFTAHAIKIQYTIPDYVGVKASKTAENGEILLQLALSRV